MLLIDGVRFELWTPSNEDEFERVVKEHAQEIFGEQSIYLDMKRKLRSVAGIGSIPDGFVIVFGDSPHWHIVEVELSSHPLREHIVSQVGRFISGIENPRTQNSIVNAIYDEITNNDFSVLRLRKATVLVDIHRFLADLISKPPILTIIIEKATPELKEALRILRYPQEIEVVEFQTFTREGVEGLAVHAHLFEPIYVALIPTGAMRDVKRERLVKAGGAKRECVRLEQLVVEGLLEDGQVLYFYHTRFFKEERAQIVASKNKLKYEADGQLYPISNLAEKLSQQHGLPHGSRHKVSGRKWGVSGPKYWKTEDGKSLYDLFQQLKIIKGSRM